MKHLYLNLKRFDISPVHGGVNRLAPMMLWGSQIVRRTQEKLKEYDPAEIEFVQFLPEAHLLNAVAACSPGSPVQIGCQSVYREDTAVGGKFGAFTSNLPASAAAEIGCKVALIGHCEERNDKLGVLAAAGVTGKAAKKAVEQLLNAQVLAAQKAGLKVLYCVGETSEEQSDWETVLGDQLDIGLAGADQSEVVIAYEPIWSIGPGKTPADKPYIEKIARFVKQRTGGMDVVYGGGLKAENAAMLASIPEIDGGLIALTRFTGEIGFYPEEYLEIIGLYLAQ